jgi:PleD family two-component response regulator
MTLLIIGSSISAALADKKLQHKDHDLQRVNSLLSQLDQARMSLQQVAHYDALTNLINRRGFNQIFAEKLIEKTNEGGMLAVLFLDIDHFKRINDSLGHDAGDELLKVLAGHIKARYAVTKMWWRASVATSSAYLSTCMIVTKRATWPNASCLK